METFSALLAICFGEFTGHRWIPLTKASDTELFIMALRVIFVGLLRIIQTIRYVDEASIQSEYPAVYSVLALYPISYWILYPNSATKVVE